MEAGESKNREPDPTGYEQRLSAPLARGCCVLPITLMYVGGLVTVWARNLGLSDKAWSWIALGALAAAAATPGAFLASPWLKLASLLLLVAALYWSGKKGPSAS
ncbi:MAG: hypothetical protein WD775_02255 [Burkholderiales bacterium]